MGSILNIAHRGFHKNYPDNTMEAFDAALKLGVDGIEFDVQETIDNAFIIHHDDKLNGVEICKMPLAEVENIKLKNECEIPSLVQVLDLCRKHVKLFADLKKIESISKLMAVLEKEVVPEDIVLVSFHKELISGISFLAPIVDTALITSLPLPNPVKLAREALSKGIVVRCGFTDLKLVEQAREENLSIFIWDCANLKAAQKVMKLDIDGIITDFPDLVKEAAK
jgi:glycerophosphoryl diester phosphodiesterase